MREPAPSHTTTPLARQIAGYLSTIGPAHPGSVHPEALLPWAITVIEMVREEEGPGVQELIVAAEGIKSAIEEEGPHPDFHWRIVHRHGREWPTLWTAIENLMRALNKVEKVTR